MIVAVQEQTAARLVGMGINEERARAMVGGGPFAAAARNGELIDADLEVFRPDPANDRAARLLERLENKDPIEMRIVQPLTDGRIERIQLDVPRTKAYLLSDVETRERTRLQMTRERHVRTALDAAQKVAREGGVLRPLMLSLDEQLCLREYGAITNRKRRFTRENGGFGYHAQDELVAGAAAGLRRVLEAGAAAQAPAKIREDGFYPWDETNTMSRPAVQNYNGALSVDGWGIEVYTQWGPNTREMMINDVWDEQAKASWAFMHDPMVKFAIHAKVSYLLGRGLRIEAIDKTEGEGGVQAAIDEYRKRHNATMFRRWVIYGHVMGETFLREFELPGGKLRHVQVPSPSIWEVVTEAEDTTTPLYYVQRYTPRFQMYATVANASIYTERIIPADKMIHWKINDELGSSRGLSEVYASLPWHKRIRDVADAMVEREYVKNAYTTYAKIAGSKADVDAFLATMPVGRPRPNTYIAFNDKVTDFGWFDAKKDGGTGAGSPMEFLQTVAVWGYGLPKEYFGISARSTRGGAVIAEGPIQKILELRQDDVDSGLVSPSITNVVDAAIAKGGVKKTPDDGFVTIFPEIIKGDSDTRIKNLVVGRSQGWISNEDAADEWAGEMDLDDYDYEDQQDKIEKEAEQGIVLPGMPKDEDTVDQPPGMGEVPPNTGRAGGDVSGGAADPTGAPNPQTGRGQSAVRRGDRGAAGKGREAALSEAMATISRAGGIVVLP